MTGFEPATDAVLETAALPVELHPTVELLTAAGMTRAARRPVVGAAPGSEAGDALVHGPPTVFGYRLALAVTDPQRLAEISLDVRGHDSSRVRGANPGPERLREHPRHGGAASFGHGIGCAVLDQRNRRRGNVSRGFPCTQSRTGRRTSLSPPAQQPGCISR